MSNKFYNSLDISDGPAEKPVNYINGQPNQNISGPSQPNSIPPEEKPKKPKRSRYQFCCCSCLLAVVLFIIGLISAVAASGLMYVPGFSSALYEEPTPTRVITPVVMQDANGYLQQKLENEYNMSGNNGDLETEFSEAELTEILRLQLASNFDSISDIQIVILPDKLEFFGRIKQGPIDTVAIIDSKIEASGGKIILQPTSLKVGALNLPIDWIKKFSNIDLNKPITISEEIEVKEIQLQEQKLKAKLHFLSIKSETQSTGDTDEGTNQSIFQSI